MVTAVRCLTETYVQISVARAATDAKAQITGVCGDVHGVELIRTAVTGYTERRVVAQFVGGSDVTTVKDRYCERLSALDSSRCSEFPSGFKGFMNDPSCRAFLEA